MFTYAMGIGFGFPTAVGLHVHDSVLSTKAGGRTAWSPSNSRVVSCIEGVVYSSGAPRAGFYALPDFHL